jgi:hypothetical protein
MSSSEKHVIRDVRIHEMKVKQQFDGLSDQEKLYAHYMARSSEFMPLHLLAADFSTELAEKDAGSFFVRCRLKQLQSMTSSLNFTKTVVETGRN